MQTEELKLSDIAGIGESTGKRLRVLGIDTVAAVAALSAEQLGALPGFGPRRAVAVKRAAIDLLSEVSPAGDKGERTVDVGPSEGGQEPTATAGKKEKQSGKAQAKRRGKEGKKEKDKKSRENKKPKNEKTRKDKKRKKKEKDRKRAKGKK